MAIRFLTDSTADISPQEAARRGIAVVPLKSIFGETSYLDGIDLDHDTFYKMLAEAETLPTTSQPTPEEFLPHFEQAKANGDELICVMLSSTISGTYQSANIAKDICGYDKIYLIDSTLAVVGMRALIDLGMKLRDQGVHAGEIVAELEKAKEKVRLYAIVDTLEYLHKGGRLSAAVTIVGGMLKMKPVITLKDGALGVVGKGIGAKGSLNVVEGLVGELNYDERLPVYYGYTANDELCTKLIDRLEERFGPHPHEVHSVGAVIGTHVGPGVAVVVYLEK